MELVEKVAKDDKSFKAGEKIIVDEKIETGKVYLISKMIFIFLEIKFM